MSQYEKVETVMGELIKKTDDNGEVFWIPIDPANSDYQRYLNPEAEQSTPMIPGND